MIEPPNYFRIGPIDDDPPMLVAANSKLAERLPHLRELRRGIVWIEHCLEHGFPHRPSRRLMLKYIEPVYANNDP